MSNSQVVWIDVERCTGCSACVDACPVGAITLVDGLAHVDEDVCTGCRACLEVCPREAIRPVIEGELIPVEEADVVRRSPNRVPTVQRPRPLIETAAPALVVAGAGLLAKATRALARAVDNWLTQSSKESSAISHQTAGPPTRPGASRSNGGGRQMRRRRRGR
jgi:NAD-dependent dihydropyrimidine dehydrogenase PreA subunit